MSLARDISSLGLGLIGRADPATGGLVLSSAEAGAVFRAFADFTARAQELESQPVPARLRGAMPGRLPPASNVF